jgi:GT2 family glycosyltransferase
MQAPVGIVISGRNVGAFLAQGIAAAQKQSLLIVYVDSGSTDDSVRIARSQNIAWVALDASQPYTAARARNAGARFLLAQNPALEFLQFVDGDCALAENFVERALETMNADARVAVVCGQRRERFPDASVYNQLAALEWEIPCGEILACGGDALVRVRALVEVNGYNATLIAGEEPEMCLRLRRAGWKIIGIHADMTWHDARMTHFSQWWTRSVRAGHAYAEGAWRHGREPEHHWVHESASIWLWGAGVWGAAFALAKCSRGTSLGLLLSYLLLGARIYKRSRARGWTERDARLYAFFCVLGKFPQLQGQWIFLVNRLRGRATRLIEPFR